MKIFENDYLAHSTKLAKRNPRLRQHRNIHQDFQEPCQRLFNAIEPGSYIQPHRHASDPRDELLVAIRGEMALITFSNEGTITDIIRLGTEKFGEDGCSAVEIPFSVWHTVVALEPGSILLEIKAGPFDSSRPKDLAPWSPKEMTVEAEVFLSQLLKACQVSF